MFKLTNELFAIQIKDIQDFYFNNDLLYPSDSDASSFLKEIASLQEDFTEVELDNALDIIGSHVEFYDMEQSTVDAFKSDKLRELEKVATTYQFEKSNLEQGTFH